MNNNQTFTFNELPQNLAQFQARPEATLSTPYQTAALTVAALCLYGNNPQTTVEILNFLKGPQPMSPFEIQFLRDRLMGKAYKPFSFFQGSSPENNYTPQKPYSITIFSNPYSFQEKGYAMLLIQSSGADNPRQIKLREKPSSGQWFFWENFLLADIRTPQAEDPWA